MDQEIHFADELFRWTMIFEVFSILFGDFMLF